MKDNCIEQDQNNDNNEDYQQAMEVHRSISIHSTIIISYGLMVLSMGSNFIIINWNGRIGYYIAYGTIAFQILAVTTFGFTHIYLSVTKKRDNDMMLLLRYRKTVLSLMICIISIFMIGSLLSLIIFNKVESPLSHHLVYESLRMIIDIKDDNDNIKMSAITDDMSTTNNYLLHYKISLATSIGTSLISILLYPAWKFAGLFVVLFIYSPGLSALLYSKWKRSRRQKSMTKPV
ncbi:hypothetical protein HDU92_004510 [Lobulomyces angularis]|nr:hypothetical protein HDU92_004510 [Lobulomyces angularis]